jgi:hypothetical protein
MTDTNKTIETGLGLVTCGKDFKTLHIGTVTHEIKNADKPWKSTRSIEATANCAGSRHVSDKYSNDLQSATCPRCRAAYLGEVIAPATDATEATPTVSPVATQDATEINKGDYLTLAYGQGTQTAYVSETTEGRLMIYRLIGYAGRWTGPRPMSRKDSRIIAKVAGKEGVEPPATGFISAR